MAKFTIVYSGVDSLGEPRHFSSLAAAARYVRARWLGEEWRRIDGLQMEFGNLDFMGFTWHDIRPDGKWIEMPRGRLISRKSKDVGIYAGIWRLSQNEQNAGNIYEKKSGGFLARCERAVGQYIDFSTFKEARQWISDNNLDEWEKPITTHD